MSRRIDIEITSARPDGTYTWRAAGAREPKGVVDGSLLPANSATGSILRADAEFELDGITIVSVTDPKARPAKTGLLELIPSSSPFETVTQQLARRDRGDRPRSDRPRADRADRGERERAGRDRPARDRPTGDRRPPREAAPERAPRPERRSRPSFTPPPELPQRPKAKRLKPGKAHRHAVLADLPEAQRAVAERALQGGIPAVRQAVVEQNERLKAEGKDEIPAAGLVAMAEQLLPKLRVAEWLDRADAAQADIDELDLRDLRSVVAAADDPMVARDETTRAVAEQLKQALAAKQEKELGLWFADIDAAITVGRVIRALKLSSQPPKAGIRFPADLSKRLADAATASLAADALPDRWAAVLEAAAFSPIRAQVVPAAPPATVTDELRSTVTRLATLLPQIASLFGIEAKQGRSAPKPLRPTKPAKPAKPVAKTGTKPAAPPPPAAPAAPDEHTATELSAEADVVAADQIDEHTAAEIVASIEQEAATVVEQAAAPAEALPVVDGTAGDT